VLTTCWQHDLDGVDHPEVVPLSHEDNEELDQLAAASMLPFSHKNNTELEAGPEFVVCYIDHLAAFFTD
jgi:hypothetical protein